MYFHIERLINDLKNLNLMSNFGLREDHFDHFQGQTSCFLRFLKVVLEMFRSCLGIVFGLNSHTFIRDKVLLNNPSPLGSRVSPKTERGARGCVGGWCGGGGGWAYFPFYTLDHVGTIFFKFLGL